MSLWGGWIPKGKPGGCSREDQTDGGYTETTGTIAQGPQGEFSESHSFPWVTPNETNMASGSLYMLDTLLTSGPQSLGTQWREYPRDT